MTGARRAIRHSPGPLALVVLVGLSSCAPGRPAVFVPEVPRPQLLVDWPVAWTPDGKSVVFRRLARTTLGEPGLYVLDLDHPPARRLMSANLFWPITASFSPDGKKMLVSQSLVPVIVDLASGATMVPFSTSFGVEFPVWLADGHRILYYRAVGQYNTPSDSLWFHVYDLATGRDEPVLRNGGAPIRAIWPARSPRSGEIVMDISTSALLVAADLSSFRSLPVQGRVKSLQWTFDGTTGEHRILLGYTGNGGQVPWTVSYDPTSGVSKQVPEVVPAFDRISPDGTMVLTNGVAADDPEGALVLFMRRIGDPLGSQPIQVTSFVRQ